MNQRGLRKRILTKLSKKEEEAQRLAEEEVKRLEQERLVDNASKQAEFEIETLEKEQILAK